MKIPTINPKLISGILLIEGILPIPNCIMLVISIIFYSETQESIFLGSIYLFLSIFIIILLIITIKRIRNKKRWGIGLGLILEILLTIVKIISYFGVIEMFKSPSSELSNILNSIGYAYVFYMFIPGIDVLVIILGIINLIFLLLSVGITNNNNKN